MERLETSDYTIEFDPNATRTLYSGRKPGKADSCECDTCRNFARQRAQRYSPETFALFERLGIDADKEDEILGYYFKKDETRYSVPFDFVGRVVTIAAVAEADRPQAPYRFENGANYPWGQEDADRLGVGPIANVCVNLTLPWVLDEPPGVHNQGYVSVRLGGRRYGGAIPAWLRTATAYARWIFGGRGG